MNKMTNILKNPKNKTKQKKKTSQFNPSSIKSNSILEHCSHISISQMQWPSTKMYPFVAYSVASYWHIYRLQSIHSEAWTKWSMCCRRYFQMHFLEWNILNFNGILLKYVRVPDIILVSLAPDKFIILTIDIAPCVEWLIDLVMKDVNYIV